MSTARHIRWVLIALAATALAACTGDQPGTTSAAIPTPTPTPSRQPATPPSDPSPSPLPTEVPTGPDDPGWAEHLGLTEEELEERRASDDFLEWAEPRRARESPGAEYTMRRMLWRLPMEEQTVLWANPEEVWPDVALPFRDRLLAAGGHPNEAIPGVPERHGSGAGGYVHISQRGDEETYQRYVLVGFYIDGSGETMALVDQVALEALNPTQQPTYAEGKLRRRRSFPMELAVGEDWEETYEQVALDTLAEWAENVP